MRSWRARKRRESERQFTVTLHRLVVRSAEGEGGRVRDDRERRRRAVRRALRRVRRREGSAASSRSATSSTRRSEYPDTVVASALWNMEPTIDRAIAAVKSNGKFKAEDYGQYSLMKHKGSELAPLGTFDDEGAGRSAGEGQGEGEGDPRRQVQGCRRRDGAQVDDEMTATAGGRRSRRRAAATAVRAGRPAMTTALRRRFASPASPSASATLVANDAISLTLARRRSARAARRERRRQVHAGIDPVRPLRRRRGHDRGVRQAVARPATRPRRSRPASAWFTSISRLPTTCRCRTTSCSAREPLWRSLADRAGRACAAARDGGTVRIARGSRRARRLAVRRRAATRRDPEGALPRRADPDPRRADVGADAAGGSGAVRHARAPGRRRTCRSSSSATS